MTMPWPDLDDRRFQDFVDDAKRHVQLRCPEWTDHNVSDPGVTLIEAAASMADQIGYRLNRVPDRLYLAFLDLIGVRLLPPKAATTSLLFTLAAPQPEPLLIPAGTEVATSRMQAEAPVVFATEADCLIPSCRLDHLMTTARDGNLEDHTADLERGGRGIACFSGPTPENAMLFGLSVPVPSCVAVVRLGCHLEGVGVDPRQPPLAWEAWTDDGWLPCEVESDSTGGLNRHGDVVLRVPAGHTRLAILDRQAAWIRCRLLEARPGQPQYVASPTIHSAEIFTVGGVVGAVHARSVRDEILGVSDGTPGQRFPLAQRPVLEYRDMTVEVGAADGRGWEPWEIVEDFADSRPGDKHARLLGAMGIIEFGPAIKQTDGTVWQAGAIPSAGAHIRVPVYRSGGGAAGNLAPGSLSVLRSSIPEVASVSNIAAAVGGVDPETIEEAKVRGPLWLRTRSRALTAADYTFLAVQASDSIARAHCIPAEAELGARVLVVPHAAADENGSVEFHDLIPGDQQLAEISDYLERRRPIGARFVVQPPRYRGVTVVAKVHGSSLLGEQEVSDRVLRALYRYLSPLTGGADGTGWEFGGSVHRGDLFGLIRAVPGVNDVDEVHMYAVDPITKVRGRPSGRLHLEPDVLIFSMDHQVRVILS